MDRFDWVSLKYKEISSGWGKIKAWVGVPLSSTDPKIKQIMDNISRNGEITLLEKLIKDTGKLCS